MNKSKFNGDRLREARQLKMLTITELAKKVNVTKQMISKYEHKLSVPGTETLFSLIKELNFPSEFFFGKDSFEIKSTGTFYRSRLTATKREKKPSQLLLDYTVVIRDFLEKYIDFPVLKEFDNTELFSGQRDPAVVAKYLRKQWNLKNLPIPNIVDLLERRGFVISSISNLSKKVDAFSSPRWIKNNDAPQKYYYPIVLEGTGYSFYRQQFSVAHELGHWALHSNKVDPQELDNVDYRKMEQEANEFASEFLLPREEFEQDIKYAPKDIDLYLSLKNKWLVSISMMIVRARDIGVLSQNDYVNMQRKISYKNWRKVEPFDVTKEISKPQALKQSIELLVENDILSPFEIKSDLAINYNILLPDEIIAEICGVDVKYLRPESNELINDSNIKVKKVDFGNI